MRLLYTLTVMVLLSGCNGDQAASAPADDSSTNSTITYALNGAIQKGPFSQGTSVTIQELDSGLSPTGLSYTWTHQS